jgi:hypothetical protein
MVFSVHPGSRSELASCFCGGLMWNPEPEAKNVSKGGFLPPRSSSLDAGRESAAVNEWARSAPSEDGR